MIVPEITTLKELALFITVAFTVGGALIGVILLAEYLFLK